MPSKLKARFERLGRVQDVAPGNIGSPVVALLRVSGKLKPIDAIRVLVGSGLTMLKAKRVIEALQDRDEIEVRLPAANDATSIFADLADAGVHAVAYATAAVDVNALREKLGLTQEQFALRYNLPLSTVQHWEQGRELDQVANNYLRIISQDSRAVVRSQLVGRDSEEARKEKKRSIGPE